MKKRISFTGHATGIRAMRVRVLESEPYEVSIAKTERVSRRPNPVFDNLHLRRSMDGALNLKTVFEARERSRSPVITKTE